MVCAHKSRVTHDIKMLPTCSVSSTFLFVVNVNETCFRYPESQPLTSLPSMPTNKPYTIIPTPECCYCVLCPYTKRLHAASLRARIRVRQCWCARVRVRESVRVCALVVVHHRWLASQQQAHGLNSTNRPARMCC